MNVSDYIVSKAGSLLTRQPEITPAPPGFEMFNTGGTELEVGDFLYSLVRMVKPNRILETGTHLGISSTYMGQALKDNGKGVLHTMEIFPANIAASQQLWKAVEVDKQIVAVNQASLSLQLTPADQFEILFLDSEPQYRFDEFIKFWPNVVPGGFILIHDLHPSMGHHGQTWHNTFDWPYGDFRPKLGPFMKRGDIQTISFPTPRGFTMFQKRADTFLFTKHILDEEIKP
jgi:predicted O-methyltransferase YrrM